ncbi:MAG: DedA family protein [Candidatus Omnitrophica bacterium]|nr:DedA family protein [Candidatus Omnitrophota bacterium]
MESLLHFLDFFIHLDKHLLAFVQDYGAWTYLFLFLIIFCETGLVVTPFLPGDSLLFVAGALAATGSLNIGFTVTLLSVAAVLGDTVNYWIGSFMGHKISQEKYRHIFKPEYLERTHNFFEKHGAKTIILARFFPIIRTFAPFLAGAGKMSYRKFFFYNVAGALIWIFILTLAGYFFGNIPFVKKNFTAVIFGIIIVSLLPGVWEYYKHKRSS